MPLFRSGMLDIAILSTLLTRPPCIYRNIVKHLRHRPLGQLMIGLAHKDGFRWNSTVALDHDL